jgi:hypothetical protein
LQLSPYCDIIIPKDEVSGSASDAKVADFIEFIVKDDMISKRLAGWLTLARYRMPGWYQKHLKIAPHSNR